MRLKGWGNPGEPISLSFLAGGNFGEPRVHPVVLREGQCAHEPAISFKKIRTKLRTKLRGYRTRSNVLHDAWANYQVWSQ